MKLRMDLFLRALVVVMALALAVPATADVRRVNTYICRPDRDTRASDLAYDRWGITNVSRQTQYIVCPIIRDAESQYARMFVQLTISFSYFNRSNPSGAAMGCSAYETDRALGITKTFTSEGSAPAALGFGETAFVYTGYEYDRAPDINGQISLHCRLAPGLTFYGLTVQEPSYTAASP